MAKPAKTTTAAPRARKPGAARSQGNKPNENARQFTNTLARGLTILRCFTPTDTMLGNKDIAQRTGLPKPTVSRFTHTLTELGYLNHESRSEKFQLGSGVLSMAYPLLASMRVRHIARPFMEKLAEYCNGVVSMAVRDRLDMVYVEACRSNNALVNLPDIGARASIAGTCTGRAFLAACPPTERDRVLAEIKAGDPEAYRANWKYITRALEDIRVRGFCMSPPDQTRNSSKAVAAPMSRALDGRFISFNCGVPPLLAQKGQLERDLGPRLVAMVKQVEIRLAMRS